jgi:serine/threonine protein kinase
MSLAAGSKLGPYEILSPLGAGGMGEVFRARDTRLGRDVAIKIFPERFSGRPELRERFEREARTISALNHARICTIYDVGHQDDVQYLVMEFLEGETLAERIQKGPLPLREIVRIGMEICEALDAAHRAWIIHRDLKPANVMLTANGAKLMDFGLAKASAAAFRGGNRQWTEPAFTAYVGRAGRRHDSIHVAGAARRQRSRRAVRHFCARRSFVRNGDREAPVRR